MEPSIYDDNVLVGQSVGVLTRVEDHQTMADAMVLLSQCFSFPLTFLLTLSDMEEAYAKCRIYANTKKIRSDIYDVGKRYFQNKVVLGA